MNYDQRDPLKGATPCASCGSNTRTLQHVEYRWVCGVCGSPKINVASGHALSGRERGPLLEVKAAKKGRAWWQASGVFSGIAAAFIAFITFLGSAVLGFGWLWTGLGVAMLIPFAILAFIAIGRSKELGEKLKDAMDRAWVSAARDVASKYPEGITGEQLASALPISEADAEEMIARLAVDGDFRTRITDDGALSLTPTNVRFETEADRDLAAEIDALAAEHSEEQTMKR